MGQGQSRNTKPSVWYEYSATKCVSNSGGTLQCVAVRGNSRNANASNTATNRKATNSKATQNNKEDANTKQKRNSTKNRNKNNASMGLRKRGRQGILSSII